MAVVDSRLYWIWLQNALGAGYIATHKLLRVFNDAKEIYEAPSDVFEVEGMDSSLKKKLKDKNLDKAKEILSLSLKNNGWILTPDDEFYPDRLRSIPALPLVLYGRGEMPRFDLLPSVAIVGTRESTEFGRRATALISGGLALGGIIVISGGALGIDSIAHRAALEAGGITVAVQGCGLDVNYPRDNAKMRMEICEKGAVITEYPPGTKPLGSNFPVRNRIMSGLSLGVCIVEAPERSGALITARHAVEQGRDVFAVAGDMLTRRSPGTDGLIQSGAMLITGAGEILEEYQPLFPGTIDLKVAKNIRQDPRFDTRKYKEGAYPYQKRGKKPQNDSEPDNQGGESGTKNYYSNNTKGAAAIEKSKKPKAEAVKEEKEIPVLPEVVSHETKAVYDVLTKNLHNPMSLTDIIRECGYTAPQVMIALTELELMGIVKNLPGQRYCFA